MGDVDKQEQYAVDEIDWENLLQNIPESMDLLTDDLYLSTDTLFEDRSQRSSEPSPVSDFHCIGEIEHFLLEEDKEMEENQEFSENFFSEYLLDVSDDGSSETRVTNDDNMDPKANSSGESEAKEKSHADAWEVSNGGDEDLVSKKRKRQMRNRDSAMKSRERKKMYVRDLEMKSKFLEGECRRLGNILQSYVMENQALHHILQKTRPSGGVSSTKQESAVLSLESLLLGSLFWLVSIVCLLFLDGHNQAAVLGKVGSVGGSKIQEVELGAQGLRETRNDKLRFWLVSMGRRCKATRTKMRLSLGCNSVLLFAPGFGVRF
eukprot:TRINITY_DN1573_c0_g1_i4.p1 TRINITY_DN1573_c0_g1~~TRINITY_DN1573_c0_g1_i4.p1  ORF type:complete len:320 (-),score=61.56 TRINITY_DN1573_c0_g1_i4:142-1101(-)